MAGSSRHPRVRMFFGCRALEQGRVRRNWTGRPSGSGTGVAPCRSSHARRLRTACRGRAVAFIARASPALTGGIADRRTGRRVTADDPCGSPASRSWSRWASCGWSRRASSTSTPTRSAPGSAGGCGTPPLPTCRSRCGCCCRIAGLTDAADHAIPLGQTVRDRVVDPRAWDAEHAPASFRYTNLNFPVVAAVIERATGERFDRAMHRLVIAPLGLDACFNWAACSPARAARAVVLYRADGGVATYDPPGGPPACPVNAPPGARATSRRTSPAKMARCSRHRADCESPCAISHGSGACC
ncbi:serine hydrolase [Sphingomonas sp. MMS24-JH45]